MELYELPSGKHTKNYGKSPFYSWVNQLFLSSCSIAMLIYVSHYQRLFPLPRAVQAAQHFTGMMSHHPLPENGGKARGILAL